MGNWQYKEDSDLVGRLENGFGSNTGLRDDIAHAQLARHTDAPDRTYNLISFHGELSREEAIKRLGLEGVPIEPSYIYNDNGHTNVMLTPDELKAGWRNKLRGNAERVNDPAPAAAPAAAQERAPSQQAASTSSRTNVPAPEAGLAREGFTTHGDSDGYRNMYGSEGRDGIAKIYKRGNEVAVVFNGELSPQEVGKRLGIATNEFAVADQKLATVHGQTILHTTEDQLQNGERAFMTGRTERVQNMQGQQSQQQQFQSTPDQATIDAQKTQMEGQANQAAPREAASSAPQQDINKVTATEPERTGEAPRQSAIDRQRQQMEEATKTRADIQARMNASSQQGAGDPTPKQGAQGPEKPAVQPQLAKEAAPEVGGFGAAAHEAAEKTVAAKTEEATAAIFKEERIAGGEEHVGSEGEHVGAEERVGIKEHLHGKIGAAITAASVVYAVAKSGAASAQTMQDAALKAGDAIAEAVVPGVDTVGAIARGESKTAIAISLAGDFVKPIGIAAGVAQLAMVEGADPQLARMGMHENFAKVSELTGKLESDTKTALVNTSETSAKLYDSIEQKAAADPKNENLQKLLSLKRDADTAQAGVASAHGDTSGLDTPRMAKAEAGARLANFAVAADEYTKTGQVTNMDGMHLADRSTEVKDALKEQPAKEQPSAAPAAPATPASAAPNATVAFVEPTPANGIPPDVAAAAMACGLKENCENYGVNQNSAALTAATTAKQVDQSQGAQAARA